MRSTRLEVAQLKTELKFILRSEEMRAYRAYLKGAGVTSDELGLVDWLLQQPIEKQQQEMEDAMWQGEEQSSGVGTRKLIERINGYRKIAKDAGTAGDEVLNHLPSHIAGKGRDTARRQPVVTGKHHHLRLLQHRRGAAQNLADLERHIFQAPKRAQRFGFVVKRVLQRLRQCRIGNIGQDSPPQSKVPSGCGVVWKIGRLGVRARCGVRRR